MTARYSELPPLPLTPGQWRQVLEAGAGMQFDDARRYVLQTEQGASVWRAVCVFPPKGANLCGDDRAK